MVAKRLWLGFSVVSKENQKVLVSDSLHVCEVPRFSSGCNETHAAPLGVLV